MIVFLVGTFTFVSTFTGEAIADVRPAVELPTGQYVASNPVLPFVNVCTLRRSDPSLDLSLDPTSQKQPEFKNPPFADADQGPVTLRATQAPFTLEGNGKGEDTEYQGYVYEARAMIRENGRFEEKTLPPSYTPPVIEVSPSQEEGVDNVLNVKLINDLPVNVQLAGSLPQTKENLESVSQYTNIHYHGFNVSPLLGADDVLVDVPSNVTPIPIDIPTRREGEIKLDGTVNSDDVSVTYNSFSDNQYQLIPVPPLGETTPDSTTDSLQKLPGGYYPTDDPAKPKYGGPITEYNMNFLIPDVHQSGLFWYHSHAHSLSDQQVLGGLSGGIIIKGNEEYYGQFLPPTAPTAVRGYMKLEAQEEPIFEANSLKPQIAQQVMLFKDFNDVLDPDNSEDCFVLNSQVNPKITIQPGEIQLWRIANIGADSYMNIALETLSEPSDEEEIIGRASLNGDVTDSDANASISGDIKSITLNADHNMTTSDTQVEKTNGNTGITKNIVIQSGATVTDYEEKEKGEVSFKISGRITGETDADEQQEGQIKKAAVTGSIGLIPEFTQPWGKSNFYILARDGDIVAHPVATNSVLLPPAARVELLVVGGKANDTYYLVSDLDTDLTTQQQQEANRPKSYLLATVTVEGDVKKYTYTPEGGFPSCTVSVEGIAETNCTAGQHINLDYFIKNTEP
ncbi:MAG: hypothetical protein F6K13_12195, partial [Okeania sp. SIO2B9]|nr:hypothetical protein [Okeania sp. SIO2B9]